jgi:glycosidase
MTKGTHGVAVAPTAPTAPLQADDADLARRSLRAPLTRERFYFVMPDRFANGRTGNDRGGLTGDRSKTGFDPGDKGFYHGGDIAGLTQKLDYIQGLGTTAIWMTPSFKNKPVQGAGADMSAGYHGYWVTDFTQIDPHFGTNAELKAFIAKAHARGIKVFFDIITNHTADVINYKPKDGRTPYGYVSKDDYPYRDANGTPFDDRDYASSDTFPPLDAQVSFPYVPYNSPGEENSKVPPGSTTSGSTTTAATRPSPARARRTATSSASTIFH